jgi:predicted GIY-YIG superfamily endonuclease
VYNIPCDYGRCYIGQTSRPLEERIKEHKYNLAQGLLQKSKLAQYAYDEGHKICRKQAKVLQIEPNTVYRKYKESPKISLVDHPISKPSLDISPIWTPIIAAEVRKLQLRPVQIICENCVFMLVSCREFVLLMMTSILTVL